MTRHRIAVTALLGLLAAGAVAYLLTLAGGVLQDLSRRGRQRRQAAVRLQEEELRTLAAEHSAWKNLPRELEAFHREHIITMDDFARLRRELNACLEGNGLRASNISFQFGAGREHIRKVSIGLSLDGPYRNVKKFIFEMESKPKMQFFRRVELSGGAASIKGKFTMEAYLGD
ncbi:MAG: hypothetical protein JXO51_06480 [Candidatus Aminicenantes bacterium]|nr:hypothetical protein [Candidatus Aminicenantes bacterium]